MSDFLTPSPNVFWVVAAVLATMATGTLIRLLSVRDMDCEKSRLRLASLRSWWLVAAVVTVAAVMGLAVSVVLFTLVSVLAMR